jgi:hypothetical protein
MVKKEIHKMLYGGIGHHTQSTPLTASMRKAG